jgi:glycosyltransferase involved in cell wall biosynthesis
LGIPVVSTACGGPEEILAGGRFGRLVEVGDVESMAGAMLATLNEPPRAEDLQMRAQQYSVERVTQMYLDHLNA